MVNITTEPLVSIIVPVYNMERYLDECMQSILHQTYQKIDIILVDDGSQDKSGDMCDEYLKKDNRIQVLHKKNGGLMSAWMAGVEIAKGEYLAFVDSDDWIELNMIEELVQHLKGLAREVICSNYIIEKEEKKKSIKVKQSLPAGIYEREEIEKQLLPYLLGKEVRKIHSSRCMKLISKELVTSNMQYANKQVTMGEDLNIIFPVLLDAERIVVVEEGYFYHYRFVDASMVHKYNSSLSKKIEILVDSLQEIIQKKVYDQNRKTMLFQGLQKEYIYLLFIVLKNELRGPGKGIVTRIQNVLQNAKEDMKLEHVVIEVSGMANKLLYFIWKKPNAIRIMLGRVVIGIFDKV